MRVIVGLGNPGEKYRRTRHNVGFMVVDALGARVGAGRGQAEYEAWTAEAEVAGEPVLLVKPLTFMNRSGVAVEGLLASRNLAPSDMVVVVDDVALPLGALRLRERGSHGGHNGLRSIIDVLGTEEFPRIRVGIARDSFSGDLAEFVLSAFPEDEILTVQEMVGQAADAVESLIREGAAAAMNRFNGTRVPEA